MTFSINFEIIDIVFTILFFIIFIKLSKIITEFKKIKSPDEIMELILKKKVPIIMGPNGQPIPIGPNGQPMMPNMGEVKNPLTG